MSYCKVLSSFRLFKINCFCRVCGSPLFREGYCSAMSVGLLAVRLLYRFYVCVHLSKWFTFSQFSVVCSLLSCRLLRLLVTFCS